MQYTHPDKLNKRADEVAADTAEVAFHSGNPGPDATDNETVIPRESLTFTPAGDPGEHPRQVERPGRAWSQMLSVEVPAGVRVEYLSTWDGDGNLCDWRAIPPVVGPIAAWPLSVPIDVNTQ